MGPLRGIRVIEVAGIGPGPFCGMMLADMGCEVIRVEREQAPVPPALDPLARNRRSIVCNLKSEEGLQVLLDLAATADVFLEGYRPGVAEKLGFGPDICLQANPRLVYGRMTGWGQDGPLSHAAGHDINYIALSGALKSIGKQLGKPVPPLNLIGDFGGGGMLLAFGIVCALLHVKETGEGQVIDAAMVDGTNLMMSMFHLFQTIGLHDDRVGSSVFGGAAHFYNTYETLDGEFISIAALEPKFYEELVERLALDKSEFLPGLFDFRIEENTHDLWHELGEKLAIVFKTKTRAEWCEILEGTDVCFAPVLSLEEAADHPHHQARNSFIDVGGMKQSAPAPRFSVTEAVHPRPGVRPGTDTEDILRELKYERAKIDRLSKEGAIRIVKESQ